MSEPFHARRTLLNDHLARLAASLETPPILAAPLRRAMTLPGKRVRGLLTLAVAEVAGSAASRVLGAAASVEMVHASSLILDDLPAMDDALLRRGQPALHREFGEDLAILTAVALLNHAYGLLAQAHADANPRRWPLGQVLQQLVDAVGWNGSIAGEAVDLHSDGSALDFDTLEFIHSRKTGALFVAAAAIGGMLGNMQPAPLQRIETFAKNLGLAFQITDDVLDVTSTAQDLGKDAGKDENRLTFVKLAGVDGARKLSEELVDTALAAIQPLGSSAEPLRQLALLVRNRVQ
jgi:geranylgeranyl diphosphate synthase type II